MIMAGEHSGYLWVVEAAEKYGVSRQYLDTQVRMGKFTYTKFPADKRVYLLTSELDSFFSKPEEQGRRGQDAG